MKSKAIMTFGLGSIFAFGAPALHAEVIVQDTFQDRAAGTALLGSTTSDGTAVWASSDGAGGTIFDQNGLKAVNFGEVTTGDRHLARVEDGSFFDVSDGVFEFTYHMFETFADNSRLEFNYRLEDPASRLTDGGEQAGYSLNVQFTNVETSPGVTERAVLLSLNVDAPGDGNTQPVQVPGAEGFVVGDFRASAPGTPGPGLDLRLEVLGNSHRLLADAGQGEIEIFNVIDDTFAEVDDAFFNFASNTSRSRGISSFQVSVVGPGPRWRTAAASKPLRMYAHRRRRVDALRPAFSWTLNFDDHPAGSNTTGFR